MARQTDHTWTVDGIEEGMARVEEDGARMVNVPTYLLPDDVQEAQILRVSRQPGSARGSVVINVSIDAEATSAALAQSKATTDRAMAQSRKRDPGGNISL